MAKAIKSRYFRFTNMQVKMKNLLLFIVLTCFMVMAVSCSLFKPKYGCPTNGKNVGAEKLMGGDAESEKAARKAKKFKS
jgi:hypothetical protein